LSETPFRRVDPATCHGAPSPERGSVSLG
jgi:hypothetical protein